MSPPNRQPLFDVPPGAAAGVKIIDTTSSIEMIAVSVLMEPPVPGFDYMPRIPSWSFLIESAATGRKALFDLGIPKDVDHMAGPVVQALKDYGWKVEVEKNVADVLVEGGVDLNEIHSIVWSHWHWDHLGDPSTFPPSTELVVGPGFKKEFMPGFPANADSPVRESDFAGRQVREISFEEGDDDNDVVQIGDFRAVDFFGDGSFYLLDTPGHAIGHVCGLARTTVDPDTFIFMGGDLCHHGGELRPSEYIPLPAQISPHPVTRALQPPCPGAAFHSLQTTRNRSSTTPFFDPVMGLSIPEAVRSIKKAQKADAEDNVLFIYAHDVSVRGVADLFPLSANEWHSKGWRDQMFWAFLADFHEAVRSES